MKNIPNNRLDLFKQLTKTSFKLRYNDSILGFIWVLLKPLVTFAILYVVFSSLRPQNSENFQIYLLLGVMLYSFFSESVTFGMNSLLDKAHIILKVNFPKQIALASSLSMSVINFMINMIVLVIFIIFNPVNLTVTGMLYFGLIALTILGMTYALSLFTSIITVRLKDLKNIVEILLQLGFYATPIFYSLEIVPEKYRSFIELNPLTILIQAARRAVLDGTIGDLPQILLIILITLIAIVLGEIYFKSQVKKVAEYF